MDDTKKIPVVQTRMAGIRVVGVFNTDCDPGDENDFDPNRFRMRPDEAVINPDSSIMRSIQRGMLS